jgi:hypothetical protein
MLPMPCSLHNSAQYLPKHLQPCFPNYCHAHLGAKCSFHPQYFKPGFTQQARKVS